MRKAFLSHSSSDKTLVRQIAKAMGDRCVFDEMTFEAGMPVLDEILKGLDSSDLFVIFLSDKALDSDWVKKEISQAKRLSADNLMKILPIIIDDKITYKDSRIPQWLQKAHNIKQIINPNIILSKIYNRLRTLRINETSTNNEENLLFIGRSAEISKFEQDINNLDMWVPTYVVAYNFISGIGRRSFLKNALRKEGLLEQVQEPITISLTDKESLENFIYKLSTIKGDKGSLSKDLSVMDMKSKIDMATDLVKTFLAAREIILIIDDGGVVLPNRKIAPWFQSIVKDEDLKNRLVFCVASHYSPQPERTTKLGLYYNICELLPAETQTLFLKLLALNNINNLSAEQKKDFLQALKGVPSQVKLAVELLKSEPHYAKAHIEEVRNYADPYLSSIIQKFQPAELSYQLLVFLSKEEAMSYDVIFDVFGDNDEVYAALKQLKDYSCTSDLFDGGYLRLNPTIRDYVVRTNRLLDDKWGERYSRTIANYKLKNLDELLQDDYSKFMMVIKDNVAHNVPIPSKFFIPSLLLTAVIAEYNRGDYRKVIRLCEQMLSHTNYDENIIWTTRYRLAMAYARVRDQSKFRENVEYFQQKNKLDYHFLWGFFYRNIGKFDLALEQLERALDQNPNHSATLREKVNILIAKEDYDNAVDLAEGNYRKRPFDVIHAHSYFKALICSNKLRPVDDKKILRQLIDTVGKSNDSRAEDLKRCMTGEYAFYIDSDKDAAMSCLKEAIRINSNKLYAQKALCRIYSMLGMKREKNELEAEMQKARTL